MFPSLRIREFRNPGTSNSSVFAASVTRDSPLSSVNTSRGLAVGSVFTEQTSCWSPLVFNVPALILGEPFEPLEDIATNRHDAPKYGYCAQDTAGGGESLCWKAGPSVMESRRCQIKIMLIVLISAPSSFCSA